MNVLVDTSIWINFFKGISLPELEEVLKKGGVWVTPLIISELVSGSLSLKEEKAILSIVENLSIADMSLKHWIEVGHLRKKCRLKGYTISTPDAHIAQATLDIKALLFTRDHLFSKISKIIGLDVKLFN